MEIAAVAESARLGDVFNVDAQVGTTQSPVIWENDKKLLQTEPLDREWSSISLYLKPDNDNEPEINKFE